MSKTIFFLFAAIMVLTGCGPGRENSAEAGGKAAAPAVTYRWPDDFGAGDFPGGIRGVPAPDRTEEGEGALRLSFSGWTIRTEPDSLSNGQLIYFKKEGDADFRKLPYRESAFFAGIWNGFFLIDRGTGPENRELNLVDPGTGATAYSTIYNGALAGDGVLVVARPVEEFTLKEKPDCSGLEPGVDLPVGYMEIIRIIATEPEPEEESTGQVVCYYRQ